MLSKLCTFISLKFMNLKNLLSFLRLCYDISLTRHLKCKMGREHRCFLFPLIILVRSPTSPRGTVRDAKKLLKFPVSMQDEIDMKRQSQEKCPSFEYLSVFKENTPL